MSRKLVYLVLSVFCTLALNAFADDNITCPSESVVKGAMMMFAAKVPRPVPLPMDDDYVAGGIMFDDHKPWFVVDGIFSHVDNAQQALEQGQAYLHKAGAPMGPYHKYFDVWACVYHMGATADWDKRPKFIIAFYGKKPELSSVEGLLDYIS